MHMQRHWKNQLCHSPAIFTSQLRHTDCTRAWGYTENNRMESCMPPPMPQKYLLFVSEVNSCIGNLVALESSKLWYRDRALGCSLAWLSVGNP